MKTSLKDIPERQLALPPNILEKNIDTSSGLLSENGGRKEYFIKGTEPKRTYVEEKGHYIDGYDPAKGYYVPPELQQRNQGNSNNSETPIRHERQELF